MLKRAGDYKPSMFNVYLNMEENRVGVYNTLHDSALITDSNIIQTVMNKEGHIEDTILDSLVLSRVIFPKEFDEKQYFRFYLNKMKYAPHRATFIISLTSDCNLCCKYCFEGPKKAAIYMSDDVASKAVDYIVDVFGKNPSIRCLDIAFFGGEPLLNTEVMHVICTAISNINEISGVVRYSLTTNLTILKDSDIDLMKQYGFSNVQVALDGPQPIHDSRRKFKSGRGSFCIIIDNIKKLIDNGIKVILILNFDNQNKDSYNDLIPFINQYLPFEQLEFILNPITKSLCGSTCDGWLMTSAQEAKTYLELYSKFKQYGITVQALGQSDMLCMLSTDVSCIIDPEGSVYKCPIMLGEPNYSVGNIFSRLPSNLYYEMLLQEPWEDCLEQACAYLPVCGGGCRALALVNIGNLKSTYCQKVDYFEDVYRVVLRDHFSALLKKGGHHVKHGEVTYSETS